MRPLYAGLSPAIKVVSGRVLFTQNWQGEWFFGEFNYCKDLIMSSLEWSLGPNVS